MKLNPEKKTILFALKHLKSNNQIQDGEETGRRHLRSPKSVKIQQHRTSEVCLLLPFPVPHLLLNRSLGRGRIKVKTSLLVAKESNQMHAKATSSLSLQRYFCQLGAVNSPKYLNIRGVSVHQGTHTTIH